MTTTHSPAEGLLLTFNREVNDALMTGKPVVALESTLISHGLPWPRNRQTALDLEAAVRNEGAVPATLCLAGGQIHVGLDDDLLLRLARDGAHKVSLHNMAAVLAGGATGATTVAATMHCAHLAGIEVFATGGIGGVHRETPRDVSADLVALSRTPVLVVCAGAKAILDLPATLEVLETLGVPVCAWRADTFPAFWSSSSGLPAPRVNEVTEVAAQWRMQRALGLPGGMLLTCPLSTEQEIPATLIEHWLAQAEADPARPTGAALTPWLLKRMAEISGGRTVDANLALLEQNAQLAARVAIALKEARPD